MILVLLELMILLELMMLLIMTDKANKTLVQMVCPHKMPTLRKILLQKLFIILVFLKTISTLDTQLSAVLNQKQPEK